jgi:hypothetical protein
MRDGAADRVFKYASAAKSVSISDEQAPKYAS